MSDGTMFNGPHTVLFDTCDIRSLDRGRRRLLWEFRNSCVLDQVLSAISLETQELIDACCQILTKRLLSDAEGAQLETIGQLVGQEKVPVVDVTYNWLGTDTDESPLAVPDVGVAWMVGQPIDGEDDPLYQSRESTDEEYLSQIVAKIFRNHIKYASYPEITRYIKLITGVDVSFKRVAPLDVELIVPADLDEYTILLIMSFIENAQTTETQYLIPIAATTRIVGARRKTTANLFQPDRAGGRPDFAVVSATGYRT